MLDWIGEFFCELIGSLVPWRVWFWLLVVVAIGALLFVLLTQLVTA